MTPTATAETTTTQGRTTIAPRALDRVVSAVTADALGVSAGRVGVHLADDAGDLSLTVSTPIRVPSLRRIAEHGGVVARSGGSVLERAKHAQEQIRGRVMELTGSNISRVIVTITGVDIRQESRVQ